MYITVDGTIPNERLLFKTDLLRSMEVSVESLNTYLGGGSSSGSRKKFRSECGLLFIIVLLLIGIDVHGTIIHPVSLSFFLRHVVYE